jgi:energy-coupling factor transporter ATP-binding protein EcfA2
MRARENPFRTHRLERLAFRHASTGGVAALRRRLSQLGEHGAIVGPHGSGKTTLLRALGRQLEAEGLRLTRHFVNAQCGPDVSSRQLLRQARSLGDGDVLLFDGADQLSRFTWRRLLRAARGARGIVATAHGEGLLPTLVRTSTNAALLDELMHELVGDRAHGLRPLLRELFEAHRGNLHEVLLALYDLAARDDPRLVRAQTDSSAAGQA